jgi:hypothetical protein
MARVWQLQSSFNRGELDPRLVGRKDLQAYYAGARQAQNVMTQVQGGIRRRNGTEYLHSSTVGRLFNFSFSTEVNYCLLFTTNKIEIFKDGVLQTNINGGGLDYLATTYSATEVADIDYVQSADVGIITVGTETPRTITRTSDTAWTITAIDFGAIPEYDFNDALSPTPTSEIQDLVFTSNNEGDRYAFALEGILSDEIVFAGNEATNIENITQALIDLPNTGAIGSITATSTDINNYQITFAGDSAKAWDLVTATPILTKNVNFEVNVTQDTAGVSRGEEAWSTVRGWPQVVTFHEGRLFFGRTSYRPQTIWGSKVNEFYNFRPGKGRDDEPIDITLDTDQVNAITGLLSNRQLQVFTTGAEFYIPVSPITPANVSVQPQTNFGSKKSRPVTIDGATLFIQRTGKAIRNFTFLNDAKAYVSDSVSVLASHLISDPVEIAVSRGTSSVDANYAYIVNTDGSMAVYNSLVTEDVRGFTQWVTDGDIVSAAVVDDVLYTYVLRDSVYMLEREDVTLTTDSSASATSTDTLTGLTHLNGKTIGVVADGAYKGEFVVSGGQITIDRTATLITGGLDYTPIIETMPLNTALQNGPNAAQPKRIVRAALEIFESNSVLVNGERIANKTMGVNVFDPPSPITGLKETYLQGWDIEATLTVTQDEPMPMTILAAYLEISV